MTLARKILPLLLGLALALAPLTASARPGPGPGRRGPLIVLADLLNKLKLTAPQKTRILGLIGKNKGEIIALVGAKAEAHAQLEDAIRAQSPDPAAIKKAAGTLADVDLKIALLRARLFPQAMAVLTPRQKIDVMAVVAQAHGWMGGPGHPGMGPGKGKGHGLGPMARGMMEWMGEQVNVTPQQKEQIKGLFEARRTQLMSLHKAEREAERALGATIRQNGADQKAIRQASAEVAKARLDMALERAQMHARVMKVMTPAQRKQLDELHTDMQGARLEHVQAVLTLVRELL